MDIFMDISTIVFRAVFSAIVLFLTTKIMGYRQISQLSFYDYIFGITIGSIAADMATDLETDIWKTIIPLIIYGLLSVVLSLLTMKSIKFRRFITGTSVVLIEKGEILEDSLKKVKYDLNDLLAECRNSGYFDIADIEYAIMEHNGKISFLPYPDKRPATPQDFNLSPPNEDLCVNLILDGEIMIEHLKAIGKEEKWLRKQISQSKAKSLQDILLATYDCNETFTVYLRNRNVEPTKVLE